MDESLLRRLIGAIVLLGGAFALSLLLPGPDEGDDGSQRVVSYDLTPAPAPFIVPPPHPPVPAPRARPAPAAPATAPASRPPAAAPAPHEAAPAPTPSRTGAVWHVQIGSFGKIDNARGAVQRMRALGHKGDVQKILAAGTTVHRVRIGPYPSREAALAALRLAEAQGFGGARVMESTTP